MNLVLELRIALPQPPEKIQEYRPDWPDRVNPTSYVKEVVTEVRAELTGLVGNAPGYPSHISDSTNRGALVYHEETYSSLKRLFPESASTLVRGSYGENLVVNHPSMTPAQVCIGDEYQIGSAQLIVTGPRFPCPKVDGWHLTQGLTKFSLEQGWSGYFLKVTKAGVIRTQDEIKLISRKHPGFSIERVSKGLWGKDEVREDNEEFYQQLAGMEDLIKKGFRDAAMSRLEKLRETPLAPTASATPTEAAKRASTQTSATTSEAAKRASTQTYATPTEAAKRASTLTSATPTETAKRASTQTSAAPRDLSFYVNRILISFVFGSVCILSAKALS